jgi:hypothetical protein
MATKERTDWKFRATLLEQEVATLAANNVKLKKKLEADEKAKNSRWHLYTYCDNCMVVSSCLAPADMKIKDLDCLNCRVRGQLRLVRKVNL